jgi:hypothetical protein
MGNLFSDNDSEDFVLINPSRRRIVRRRPRTNPEAQPLISSASLPPMSLQNLNDSSGFSFKYTEHCTFVPDKQCCICLDEYQPDTIVHMLPCNHIFHRDCISEWFQKQLKCPLCQKMTENTVQNN